MIDCKVENGELLLIQTANGSIVFRGRFEGVSVIDAVAVPQVQGVLVLLDPGGSKEPSFKNLILVDKDGSVRRCFYLPDSHNAFTEIVSKGNEIDARTWNGQLVHLDLDTGKVKPAGFSK